MYLTSFLKEKQLFVSLIWLAKHICDWCDWLVCFGLGEIFLQGVDEAENDPSHRDARRWWRAQRGGGVELFTAALRSFNRQIAEEKNETY